jgi:lysophospholipase L1-like esterase
MSTQLLRALGGLGGGGGFDTDAKLIISTVGITDTVRKQYTDIFIKELKSGGFWDKIKMLYPLPELSADAQKYNWKNLAETLTFVADAEGAHTDGFYKANGSTQWAKTGKNANIFANNNVCVIFYAEAPAASGVDIGAGANFYVASGYTGNIYGQINTDPAKISQNTNNSLLLTTQLYIFSRTSTTEFFVNVGDFFENTVTVANTGTNPNAEITISAFNNTGTLANADRKGFVCMMEGVTKSEASQLQTIISKYLYFTKPADKIRWGYFRGDSNTVGTGASDTAHTWPSLVSIDRCIKRNAGQSGTTIKDLWNGRATAYFYNKLNEFITVGYGTNDFAKDNLGEAGYTLTDYANVLDDTIEYLINTKKYPSQKIIILSITYQKELTAPLRAKAISYRDAAQTVATTYNTKFVELFESMENGGGDSLIVATDYVHLNDVGHEFVKGKVLEVL